MFLLKKLMKNSKRVGEVEEVKGRIVTETDLKIESIPISMRLRDLKRELRYQEETPAEKYWEDNPGREGLRKLLNIQDELGRIGRKYPSKEDTIKNLENISYELIEKYFEERFGASSFEELWRENMEYFKNRPREDPEGEAFDRLGAEKTELSFSEMLRLKSELKEKPHVPIS